MRFLLTSAGIKNTSIHDALLDLLGICRWMRQSGLAGLLPSLREAVYMGVSAGSLVMAPNVGEDFVGWKPPTGGDRALGLVDFSMFPHLDHENLPDNSMANAEKWFIRRKRR